MVYFDFPAVLCNNGNNRCTVDERLRRRIRDGEPQYKDLGGIPQGSPLTPLENRAPFSDK
jgi:hypothetical protein